MARKLYVGNIPYDTTEQDLQALFGAIGTVDSVNVMRDMATGRARGFAFVEMATDDEAQKAIAQLNEHSLAGRNLTVNEAKPKTAPSFRGGARLSGCLDIASGERATGVRVAASASRSPDESRLSTTRRGPRPASAPCSCRCAPGP